MIASAANFFNGARSQLFRPLAGKRRAMALACLEMLHERLYGPGADYLTSIGYIRLRQHFASTIQAQSVRELPTGDGPDDTGDELSPERLAALLIRQLKDDGWIETYYDSAQIADVYRFTRTGKILIEAILRISQPGMRTRHQNLRACRAALEVFLRDLDVEELVDAFERAKQVIEDLNDNIGVLYEQVREVVSRAAQSSAWSEFDAFMRIFEREIRPQLTIEHVSRHRGEVRRLCAEIHMIEPERMVRVEEALNLIDPTLVERRGGTLTSHTWLVEQIEELVDNACNAKQPELQRALTEYTRRITGLLREVMSVRLLEPDATVDAILATLKARPEEEIEAALEVVGWMMSVSNVRMLDPGMITPKTGAPPTRISTRLRKFVPDAESRRRTAVERALAGAFSINELDALARLEEACVIGPVRLSALDPKDAREVLYALHAADYARSPAGQKRFHVRKLKTSVQNRYFSGPDYLISRKEA